MWVNFHHVGGGIVPCGGEASPSLKNAIHGDSVTFKCNNIMYSFFFYHLGRVRKALYNTHCLYISFAYYS